MRLAGALWLLVIAVSVISIVVQSGSPRLAFAANQFSGLAYLGVTVLLYQIFKPVNRDLSLFGFACGVAGVAAGAALSLNTATGLTPGFYVAMMFFGFQMMSVGYLIFRATFIPRILGVLLALGGLSYVVVSFANFLSATVGAQLAPIIVPVALLGEGSFTIWLLVKGAKPA